MAKSCSPVIVVNQISWLLGKATSCWLPTAKSVGKPARSCKSQMAYKQPGRQVSGCCWVEESAREEGLGLERIHEEHECQGRGNVAQRRCMGATGVETEKLKEIV